MVNLSTLQAFAAIVGATAALLGGIYAVVTRPLLNLMKAEMEAIRAEIKAESAMLRTELVSLESRLRTDLGALESRLNDRIDARIVRR